MANAELTSPALTTAEQQERLDLKERVSGIRARISDMNRDIADLMQRLGVLDRKFQQSIDEQSPSLEDLLNDPSYATDGSFMPSARDTRRRETMEQRRLNVEKLERDVMHLGHMLLKLRNLPVDIRSAEQKIEAIRTEIDGASWWQYLLKSGLNQELSALTSNLQYDRSLLAGAPEHFTRTDADLAAQKDLLASITVNETYDEEKLHGAAVSRILPRTAHAVLLSFDGGTDEVTIRMPGTPDGRDYDRTITFRCSQDPEAFLALVGNDVMVKESEYGDDRDIRDIGKYGLAFKDQPVPFPLETVDIKGKEEVRIAQAVWARFMRG